MPKSMARNIDIPMYNSLEELLLMCLKLMMMIAHHDVCPNLNENDYSLDQEIIAEAIFLKGVQHCCNTNRMLQI